MKKVLGLLLALVPSIAFGQNAGWPPPAGAVAFLGVYNTVLPTITNGQVNFLQTDANGKLLVSGSFSASTTGFRPVSHGTPISVTTGGVTGTLPTNTGEVVATNVGTTNGAYCALGASATTSDQYIAPNGGWFGFAISGDTQLTCITSTSTTTVNMAGGSGLPTGTGGGGGGSGGGGAITAAASSYSNGAYPALETLITSTNTKLDTLNTTAGSAIPAGSALIGKVGIDQTTPGTTNGVVVNAMTTADPCLGAAKTNLPITSNTSALTQIIAASGSTKVYICSLAIISASAEWITFNTGTGTNCGTGTAGLIGGTTVGTNGLSLAANGGLTLGNGGGTIALTGAGGEVCVALSSTTYVTGNLTYVQQ